MRSRETGADAGLAIIYFQFGVLKGYAKSPFRTAVKNENCKMQIFGENHLLFTFQFDICNLHFIICIPYSKPAPLAQFFSPVPVRKPQSRACVRLEEKEPGKFPPQL